VNFGSRFNRAGFTGTRRVLVSAVPSAGIVYPACMLAGPGLDVVILMSLAPAGEVDRGVEIAICAMPAGAGEHPIGERQVAVNDPTGRAELLDGYQRSATTN
jgi:hypothetical protein